MREPRILYIDNQFETKHRNAVLLFSNQFDVFPVSNIKEAISVLRVLNVDLIICDMHLPDGDADHLIQTVKASNKLQRIPVVVITAKHQKEEKDRVFKLGASEYLEKGEDPTVFAKIVKENIPDQGARLEEASGLSGQLAKLKIVDLIIHLVKDHGSGAITIDGPIPMEIHLRDGNIVHARHGITVGKKALFRCLRIAEAAYHFQAVNHPIEASLSGGLTELLQEAKRSNEKLMANSHKLPHPNYRVRIARPELLQKTKLKTEARAALEICKKYPRIGAYLDRLNLPDIICYEYLLTFLERGFLELVTEKKPVKIITDAGCDLPPEQLRQMGVEVLPLQLQMGEEVLAGETLTHRNIFNRKLKQLEQANVAIPEAADVEKLYRSLVPTHDCLSIFTAANLCGAYQNVQAKLGKLLAEGLDGKTLLPNEMTAIDSHTMSLGLGLLVEYAVQLAEQGLQVELIEDKLLQAMARLHLIFAVVPERSFLFKKGTQTYLINWDGARFHISEKLAKGDNLQDALYHQLERRIEAHAGLHLSIGHVAAVEEAENLRNHLLQKMKLKGVRVVPINPLTAYRFGLGTIGIALFQV